MSGISTGILLKGRLALLRRKWNETVFQLILSNYGISNRRKEVVDSKFNLIKRGLSAYPLKEKN